jgi:hypothetical protein
LRSHFGPIETRPLVRSATIHDPRHQGSEFVSLEVVGGKSAIDSHAINDSVTIQPTLDFDAKHLGAT